MAKNSKSPHQLIFLDELTKEEQNKFYNQPTVFLLKEFADQLARGLITWDEALQEQKRYDLAMEKINQRARKIFKNEKQRQDFWNYYADLNNKKKTN